MSRSLPPLQSTLLMRRGQRLFQHGQYEPALQVFQQMTQRSPQNAAAQLWTGLALAELCRWSQAQAAFQAAADLDPRDPVKQAFLARNFLDQGQPQDALAILQPFMAASPRPAFIAAGLHGLALLQTGQMQAGCGELLRLPQPIGVPWLAARILVVVEQRLLERLDESFSLDKNIVCDRPAGRFSRWADAWQTLMFSARLRLQPNSKEIQADQALFLAEQQLKAGSVAGATQALNSLPVVDGLNRLVRQIRLLLMVRDPATALKLAEDSLRSPAGKDASILRVLQAVSLLYLHHASEARAILTDVYTKGGAFAFVEYNLGLCQLAEGGSRISPEDRAAVRTRFARVLREYTLYNQTDLCRLRLEELARLTGPA